MKNVIHTATKLVYPDPISKERISFLQNDKFVGTSFNKQKPNL